MASVFFCITLYKTEGVNHNVKGCFAEYHFATTAMQHGFSVSIPLLAHSKYDLILEKNGNLKKIQIKYLGKNRYKHGNGIQVTLKRIGKKTYEKELVDYFALYHEVQNGFYIIKNEGQKSFKFAKGGKYQKNFNNFDLLT
tara:strand:+ start:974 stop:1393 length:420 start_codon:yes stop_codon:yes gene_type:complete